jgi:two-component system KDP operon response regulator KdpE
MPRILVVDGDQAATHRLCGALHDASYETRAAVTGSNGLELAGSYAFEGVLLGNELPDMTDLELVSKLRTWTAVPLIAMSSRTAEVDKIRMLDAGADHYVTKPCGSGELLARLRALLRRSGPSEVARVATEHFTIDFAARRVTTPAGDVHLTATEWRLVQVLVLNAGRVVTQPAVLRDVWGPSFEAQSQYLRVYLKQIRAKLEPVPGEPRYFLTYRGLGARFNNDRTRCEEANGAAAPRFDADATMTR